MSKKRNELCLGYITGNCQYDDGCKGKTPDMCFPPICREMEVRSQTAFCKALGITVDPWEYCMKCNPKEGL